MASTSDDFDWDEQDWDEYDELAHGLDSNGNFLPECGMTADGQCTMAGSEDCDECPNMLAHILQEAPERRGT